MPEPRILISRPDRIGDVVLSTAIPREIKNKFPDSFVCLLLRNYTKDIYTNNPYVDEVIVFEPSGKIKFSTAFTLIREIRRLKINCALMLLPNKIINLILFLSGVRLRIGAGHKFFQFIFNVKSTFRNKFIPLLHEAEYCMDMVRKIGVETDNVSPEIYLDDNEISYVNEIRERLKNKRDFLVGIHSTSGNSAPNLSVEQYKKLIELLLKNNKIRVAITDNNPPEELMNIEGVVYPNMGLQLRESILRFSALDVLISASTGPMHIASALKVNTISVFCSDTACSPKLWGPKGNNSVILVPGEKYCGNKCSGDPKKCRFEDCEEINAEKIFDKLDEMIKRKNPSN